MSISKVKQKIKSVLESHVEKVLIGQLKDILSLTDADRGSLPPGL